MDIFSPFPVLACLLVVAFFVLHRIPAQKSARVKRRFRQNSKRFTAAKGDAK
jgi:hypothetical protein